MNAHETELSDRNFESETARGLTLAFFWEPWDSSSRTELEIIRKAADVIGEQLKVGTCSVDKCPELASRLMVRSIPTSILFRDGKEEERLVGLRHEGALIKHLRKHLE